MTKHGSDSPASRQPRCFISAAAALAIATAGLAGSVDAQAVPITIDALGMVDFIQEYEYGNAQPLPPGATPMLPLFSGAARINTSFSYDPGSAVDLDPDPQAGQYIVPGTFTLNLPDVAMSFTASGNLGFSVYTVGEFHVNGNVTSFAGNVGTATPFAISFVFVMPVANDSLPSAVGAWTYGNAHISFQDIEPYRDIFIGVGPVPEPSTALMWLSAMAAGFVLRRFPRGTTS